jgi:hypothetical protein
MNVGGEGERVGEACGERTLEISHPASSSVWNLSFSNDSTSELGS